jgi:thiosulfate dehydrogenase [quinone] large subunit
MMNTSTIVLVVLATLVGLFFGNALGGLLWALILGVVTAVVAYVIGQRTQNTDVEVEESSLGHFLFNDVRSSALWLPVRVFTGWQWIDASLHKLQSPAWMDTGAALKGYWTNAVAIPAQGSPAITYSWWRSFLQTMLDAQAYTWFAKLVAIGEFLIGLGLIVGALVGIAAFFGVLMNTSFLLSGSASTNPVMLLLAIGLILAWKVAGWIGVDRYLLPLLGTPWHRGRLFQGGGPRGSTASPIGAARP